MLDIEKHKGSELEQLDQNAGKDPEPPFFIALERPNMQL
jgi:hypothetical protein